VFPVRDRVLDVKQRLETVESIPVAEQRLLFEGQDLEDDFLLVNLTVSDPDSEGVSVGLPHDVSMRLVSRGRATFRIRIAMPETQPISLLVSGGDLIWEIKKQIQAKTGVLAGDQDLSYGTAVALEHKNTLRDHPVRANSTLRLQLLGNESGI
jgi:hypothetical protein